MRAQERLEEPTALREGAAKWTDAWIRNQAEGKSWRWPVKDGLQINQVIFKILREQTSRHCSFCDGFPVAVLSVETIEHFYPKSSYPTKAFEWRNLFYCCTRCQAAKKEKFNIGILKPDEADYEFRRYFTCDYTTGTLGPNPTASLDDQQRAEITITHYKLTDGALPGERRRWLQISHNDTNGAELDDYAYRDFIS